MRIVLNPSFESFSGRLGEIQYSETKYGQIAGKAATLNDPKTPKQTAARQTLGRSSAFYGALDLDAKNEWRDYAKTLRFTDKKSGVKYVPDAIAAYNSLTDRWLAAHNNVGTPPVSPPSASYVPPSLSMTAQASGGAVIFVGSASTPPGTIVEFWLQKLPNATRKPSAGGYRVVGYSTLEQGDGNEFEVAVKPGPYAGAYRFVQLSTGLATPLVTIPVGGVALRVERGGSEAKPKAAARKAA